MRNEARIIELAKKFAGESYRRWRDAKGDVNRRVRENDGLALTDRGPMEGDGFGTNVRFADDASKEQAFMEWFHERLRGGVLEPVGERQLRDGGHWTAKYLRAANSSGIRDAGTRMREMDITPARGRDELETMFNLPVRTEQVATLFRRAFSEYEGITSAVEQNVSRELADALAAGENPRTVASRINEVVDDIGLTRARTLSRTELSRSYNRGTLFRYDRNGIERVDILNTTPCKICKPYAKGGGGPYKGPYSLDEAMGIVPIHPNCQGTYTPAESEV